LNTLQSNKKKFVAGIKWSFVQQIGTQLVNYGSVIILAVLLTPEDFGKVALVIVLIGVFESINGFGVGQLIIRDGTTDEETISTYFWLVFFLSVGLVLICLVAGGFYSLLFNLENLKEFNLLIAVSSSSLLINGVNSIFTAMYNRDMNFKSQSIYFVISIFLGNVLAVLAAYFGLGYWSLIIKNIAPVLVLSFCFLVFSPYRIHFHFHFNKALIKNAWSFTSGITYFNAVNFLVRNLDYIVIGKFFDLATVGQYSIAYKIMIFPMKNITARIQAVLYPMLANIKEDLKRVERTYTIVVSGIGYLVFPLAVLISTLAPIWVPFFFDIVKYDKLVSLVAILSIVGAAQAITSPVMNLYLISGKTGVLFRMGMLMAAINITGFFIGGLSGNIYTFVWIYAAIQILLSIPLSNLIPFRLVDFNFKTFIKKLSIPFVAALGAYLSIWQLFNIIQFDVYLKFISLGVIGLFIYAVLVISLTGFKIFDQIKQLKSIFFHSK